MKEDIKWMMLYLKAEMKATRRAVDKVEATNLAKFEAQNEWRQQMKDQTGNFVTRRELWGAVVSILAMIISAIAIMQSELK